MNEDKTGDDEILHDVQDGAGEQNEFERGRGRGMHKEIIKVKIGADDHNKYPVHP